MTIELFMMHEVQIEPYSGKDGNGRPYYGGPAATRAHVEHKRQLVRNGATVGDTALSSTTVRVPVGTICPIKSRVTLPDGTQSIVLARADHTWPGVAPVGTVPEHVELNLT